MCYRQTLFVLALLFSTERIFGQSPAASLSDADLQSLVKTYQHLHANPELSGFEEKTSSFMAKELKSMGYTVIERIGRYENPVLKGYGVVGVLKNDNGPAVLLRAELDALPIEEKTGLPFASTKRMLNAVGEDTPVMHACGHDLHMTCLLGAAKFLAQNKNRWSGTLLVVAQPAEETGSGALAMVRDGLYDKVGKPDYCLALHDTPLLAAGTVGYTPGFVQANVTSVNITVRGIGGHGAYPHNAKDPIVLSAEIISALQTIVSREIRPGEPAVVTVGSIHGGSKHNIIPDEVTMQLTVRAYKEEVRKKILASIERIATNVAQAGGVPDDKLPIIAVQEYTPATYNDPALTERMKLITEKALGRENVVAFEPTMGGEDFGQFGLEGEIPVCYIQLGLVDSIALAQSKKTGHPVPGLHSAQFAPMMDESIRTGVIVLVEGVLELLRVK